MGVTIDRYHIQKNGTGGLMKPLIYCYSDSEIEKQAVSVNRMLAEKLLAVKPNRRSVRLPNIVDSVVSSLPEESIIKDFDVLFNPEYQVDVLQMLITVCKRKAFDVIWPGMLNENRLIYGEQGYLDFKQYDINKYDVTCIV